MSVLDISQDSDPLASLTHHGIKGMQWGKHKVETTGGGESSSTGSESHGLSDRQKTALKIGGGALAVGAVIGVAVLAKNGKLPVGNLQGLNPNSLAAETKRMEQIPGTLAYKSKMARTPGTLASETARMAQIPGTIANREAQLAKAAKTSSTLKPDAREEYIRRVTEKLDGEAQRRATVQANMANRIAENAQREAREATMAARRRIVQNQSNALVRSGERNRVQSAIDGVTVRVDSTRARRALNNASDAQNAVRSISTGRSGVDVVRNHPAWNRPVSTLRGTRPPQPSQSDED